MKYPRVLVVSNNPMSKVNNMGKTLSNIFSSFPKDHLAQLYLHEGKPTSNVCDNYFSFSDKDALKSILLRWNKGNIYQNEDFEANKHIFYSSKVYSVGKAKHPIISFFRDLVWKLSNIFNKKLFKWISDFKPDLIFFASGDYVFPYKIAIKISKKMSIPLAICCFDDYYLFPRHKDEFLGKTYYSRLIKVAKKAINHASYHFAVNDLMRDEYSKHFGKPFISLFTPSTVSFSQVPFNDKKGIVYIGGLGLGRYKSLIDLGKHLSEVTHGSEQLVEIYSQENDKKVLDTLKESKGVLFKGFCNPEDATRIISSSFAVIHVESFDETYRQCTKMSLSTKIADYLNSGTLIVAYGPLEVASMKYLKDNKAGIVSDDIKYIIEEMNNCLKDKNKYDGYVNSALKLAKANHSTDYIQRCFQKTL